MPRPNFDQIITANDLLEGDVVYFTAAATWSRDIQKAEVFSDEAIAQVRLIEAMAQANVIVGAYLMPIQHTRMDMHQPISARNSVPRGRRIMPTANRNKHMYKYNDFDHAFVTSRNAQFREQVNRRISGALSEDEFKPLRLMNGLYLQLHAYMLRVASLWHVKQCANAAIGNDADRWDKGYGHFTTRQNIQFNWPKLQDVPDILDALAEVEMHAIQTSGNTIRNVTPIILQGLHRMKSRDPRIYAELIRQWSTDHQNSNSTPQIQGGRNRRKTRPRGYSRP